MDVVKRTIDAYEELAEEYSKTRPGVDAIKEVLDFFIDNLKGKEILEIGCGPGRDAKYLSEHNLDITGIDLTSNFIEMASQNVPEAKFIQMDMRYLEFPENNFDGIWSCAAFLHIPKNEAKDTLLGFRRVLKHNGLLYLSVKQGEGEYFVGDRFFSFYAQDELKDLLESCNLEVVKTLIEEKKDTWITMYAVKN
jgi:ubiquinone/menaquinone biosynthesis C-methylase UbiE